MFDNKSELRRRPGAGAGGATRAQIQQRGMKKSLFQIQFIFRQTIEVYFQLVYI